MFLVKHLLVEQQQIIAVLDRAKEGFDQIVVNPDKESLFESYLRSCFETGRAFDFEIDARLEQGRCTARQLRLSSESVLSQSTRKEQEAAEGATASEYMSIAVSITQQQTVFFLNKTKEGCDQIVFRAGAPNSELRDVMMSMFNEGKLFDFEFSRKPTPPTCLIDTIHRRF